MPVCGYSSDEMYTSSGFSALDSDDEYDECELEILELNQREHAGVHLCDLRGHNTAVFRRATPAMDMNSELLESVRDCACVYMSRTSMSLTFRE